MFVSLWCSSELQKLFLLLKVMQFTFEQNNMLRCAHITSGASLLSNLNVVY